MDPYRFAPSERTALTIEEFLEGCRAEPALAAEQLREGFFEPWLRDAGRPDLADAATLVRETDSAPVAALEQVLQAATPGLIRRARRSRGPGRVRVTAGRPPSNEEPLQNIESTETTGSLAADLPSITAMAVEEVRPAKRTRRRLTACGCRIRHYEQSGGPGLGGDIRHLEPVRQRGGPILIN